jgi:2-phospho-L-lactate guanylyltransferase
MRCSMRPSEAFAGERFLALFADLPLLGGPDIDALLDAAERAGCAIAPDRHVTGTNALALADRRPFNFHFGDDSFRQHRAEAGAGWRLVPRPGLSIDIDTPEDLNLATDRGFCPAFGRATAD